MFNRSAKSTQKPDPTFKLREATANSERLYHLPEQFAELLHDYERCHCHPALLNDIHTLLSETVALSGALVNDTTSTTDAMHSATSILGVLQRVILHLETARPGRDAFAILLPEDGSFLPSVYASREEAESQIAALRHFMTSRAFVVVPVKVTSQHALQPKLRPPADYSDLDPQIVIPTLPPLSESQSTVVTTVEEKP